MNEKLQAIDLFSGCGGLSVGLESAGIKVSYAVELNPKIANSYEENHRNTTMINKNIREISDEEFKKIGKNINIVAGCPPCQGFTKINRNNAKSKFNDDRNTLIMDYYRAIKIILPDFILMENVPEIVKFDKFHYVINELKKVGYSISYQIINVNNFGVPQNRRRLILVGSRIREVQLPTFKISKKMTVKDAIGNTNNTLSSKEDPLQNIYSHHTDRILKIIKMIPKNGGSRTDLPKKYWLACHKKKNVGFRDVYGRMSWDKPSPTITGGCLSPSKGRFLHPSEDRSISIREALLLQGFPKNYKLNPKYSKALLAQMVGNAIPPQVAKAQGEYIKSILQK